MRKFAQFESSMQIIAIAGLLLAMVFGLEAYSSRAYTQSRVWLRDCPGPGCPSKSERFRTSPASGELREYMLEQQRSSSPHTETTPLTPAQRAEQDAMWRMIFESTFWQQDPPLPQRNIPIPQQNPPTPLPHSAP